MKICGQYFNKDLVDRIKETIKQEPEISRSTLSRRVCKWLSWISPMGKPCEVSCRKALLKLDKRDMIKLPKAKSFPKRRGIPADVSDVAKIDGDIATLGEIKVIQIPHSYSSLSLIWNNLMNRYHYLGSGPLCGAQIRYLIKSKYGWVGALSFSAASWALKDRDNFIGWSVAARIKNLPYVVNNSRFLIIPGVNIPNLASHILGKCIRQLANDWQKRYNYRPVLLETFVDTKFKGTSYKAANWIKVGKSSGRRSTGKKVIYLYPLCPNWEEILNRKPERGIIPPPDNPADWAEEEFGQVEFFDNRLNIRLQRLARDFFAAPGSLIPEASGGSIASTKAAYRFFNNKRVDMDELLKSHITMTKERIKEHNIILAVQDTTILNYTSHPTTEGLGLINSIAKPRAKGLILHTTMAFTPEGCPLGLLDAQCWARTNPGKSKRRKELPISEKESMKWIKSYRAVAEIQRSTDTTLVSIGDREADLYELFYEASLGRSELLIRASKGRKRRVEEEYLWDKMSSKPVSGFCELFIPRKGSRLARTAKLEIRFSSVTLKPPKAKELPPLKLYAVYVSETNYSQPLEWMLLTTVKVKNLTNARKMLKWYTRRWGIEVYHRTLKSGCRIEDRRLARAEDTKTCLAIDMVVAWRIFFLTMQGRKTPDIPCDRFLQEDQWKVLYTYINKTLPKEPPTLYQAIRMIAKLGGFLGRKSDKEPGTTTLWRGLQRLDNMVDFYRINKSLQRAGP
jgi:hypothetical protein